MNQQAQQPAQGIHVEERFFRIDMERHYELLQGALEEALGTQLESLAHGMWSAVTKSTRWGETEVTVRATPAEGGTSVAISIQSHSTALAIGTGILVGIPAMITVLPFIAWIGWQQSKQREKIRERTITMHRVWAELSRVVGAPARAGFRGAASRTRVRAEPDEEWQEEAVEKEGDEGRVAQED